MVRRRSRGIIGIVFIIICVGLLFGISGAGELMTITGQVTEDFQVLSDDGIPYEILINDMGAEIVDHIGERVKVTGIVEEDEGYKVIDVQSYTVLE